VSKIGASVDILQSFMKALFRKSFGSSTWGKSNTSPRSKLFLEAIYRNKAQMKKRISKVAAK
jgi:hypothetical protein